MSDLPQGWVQTTLGQIATPTRVAVSPAAYQDLPYLGLEQVESTTTRILGTAPASTVRSTSYLFPPHSTLYARLRPYLNKVCSPTFEGIGSGEFITFARTPHLAPGFLKYLLNQPRFVEFTATLDTGDRPRVNWDGIRQFTCDLPPLAEQERIVAAIEEQFSRLETGSAALEQARQRLIRLRASVLQAAITGVLFREDRSEGSRRLPTSWRTVTVGDVAEVTGGITKNPKRKPLRNPIPFLRVANVPRDALDLSDVHDIEVFHGELERLRLRDGDLLVVEGNGSPDQIGRSALWHGEIDPCVHQNHLIRVRPGEEILPEYLNFYWNAPSSMELIQAAASSTSGLHTLSTGKVRSVAVSLPPMEIQGRIVAEVKRQLAYVDSLTSFIRDAAARVARLRSAILVAAFSGKLVTQEPNDESASVLLERIATQRVSSDADTTLRAGRPQRTQPKVAT